MDWEKIATERQILSEALSLVLIELGALKENTKLEPMELTRRAYKWLDKYGVHKSPWNTGGYNG